MLLATAWLPTLTLLQADCQRAAAMAIETSFRGFRHRLAWRRVVLPMLAQQRLRRRAQQELAELEAAAAQAAAAARKKRSRTKA